MNQKDKNFFQDALVSKYHKNLNQKNRKNMTIKTIRNAKNPVIKFLARTLQIKRL
jgi:hypothetical protein